MQCSLRSHPHLNMQLSKVFLLKIALLIKVTHVLMERPRFPEEIQEIITHVHDTCVRKTGVAEVDILNCEHGIFKEDRKLKCYMFCLMEEASIAEADGLVDYDLMLSMIPEEWSEQVSKMINACRHLDIPSKDKCEKTFEVHKCCYHQNPELYFLF